MSKSRARRREGKRRRQKAIVRINSATELWSALGLDTQQRDRELEQQLRDLYGFPVRARSASASDRTFKRHLVQSGIDAQDLLLRILACAQPFVRMWTDILQMFEVAAANASEQNLELRFEFGRRANAILSIDLNRFRAQTQVAEKAVAMADADAYLNNLNNTTIHRLARLIRPVDDSSYADHPTERDWPTSRFAPDNDSLNRWLDDYLQKRRWPQQLPAPPTTQVDTLAREVRRVHRLLEVFIAECRLYGERRESLRIAGNAGSPESRGPRDPRKLYLTDSDHGPAEVLRFLWRRVTDLEFGLASGQTSRAEADKFAQLIETYLDELGVPKDDAMRNAVEDLLRLPQWRRRHELYSVWLTSRVIGVAGRDRAQFDTHGGRLTFPFKATRIAALSDYQPSLEVWIEVRSPLRKPRGKGRKANIQPDLQLYAGSAAMSDPKSSFCVIEAKHYLRPSPEFIRVLADYARGRPSADVALVNYGAVRGAPTAARVLRPSIEPGSVPKRQIVSIGHCLPGAATGPSEFDEFIRRSVQRRYPPDSRPQATVHRLDVGKRIEITLAWLALGDTDLDLHAVVTRPSGPEHIWFRNRASPTGRITLSEDSRSTPGAETLTIDREPDASYRIYAHCYQTSSADFAFSACRASAEVRLAGSTVATGTPPDGSGHWWRILDIASDSRDWTWARTLSDTDPVNPIPRLIEQNRQA